MRVDLVLAALLLLAGEAAVVADPGPHPLPIAALTVVCTLPLAFRRRLPLLVVALVVGAATAMSAVADEPSQIAVPVALLIAAFTGGRELDPPQAWIALALVLAPQGIGLLLVDPDAAELVFGVLFFGGAWAFGFALRRRAQQAVSGERAAVDAERVRIARELHDIVSHSLSVVVLQTQAVRRRLGPEAAAEADDLRAVEATARQALAEMRRLLGILRADSEPASLAPQPGLDQLDELVEQSRSAGLPVEVELEGQRVALSPSVDLAAYRVVQEALTNARRHAGPARARVHVRFGEAALEVLVEDDGAGAGAPGARGGHGLAGMRERVRLYGGSVDAGPRAEGGFRVRAELPIREAVS
jgi:signal transduction histidine kinase